MTPLVLLLPLLAAMLAIALNKSHRTARYVALASSAFSLALYPFVSSSTTTLNWFSIGGANFNITVSIGQYTSILWLPILTVLVIGFLVFVFSSWFMDLPSEQRRYYVEMLAFEAAMLAFVMAENFIIFFIAWEFLSLSSYLLIGFWNSRERAIEAARKAITIVFIGDVALLAAIVILQAATGTLEFGSFVGTNATYQAPAVVTALLLVAIFTKSAQFPFHEWLPDAMEGPTPVSAYLHSSTMVKAGVFAAIVLFGVFTPQELNLMLIVGSITAVLSMLNAMREQHVKRVLAYSTIQELGLMMMAVGAGAIIAAVYFFIVQGFYKALLFFSTGISLKANDKESLNEMGGIRQNRIVYLTTLFGVLGLAGFVPFGGFFASIGISGSFVSNLGAYALISLISLGTSFYIFRWLTLQMKNPAGARVSLNYNSVPRRVILSIVVLAILSLPFLFPLYLTGQDLYDGILETLLVSAGAFAAYTVYRQKAKRTAKKPLQAPGMDWNFIYSANILNSTYRHFAAFVEALAEGFAYFEMKLNELFDLLGHLTIRVSGASRRFATGSINTYVGLFTLGVLILVVAVAVV